MSALHNYTISNASKTNLRAGIKWNPLDRDDIEESHGIASPDSARQEQAAINGQLSALSIRAALLKPFFFLRSFLFMQRLSKRNGNRRDSLLARQKILAKYLDQETVASYDLDLCCFCYDNRGTMLLAVFPCVTEGIIDPKTHAAFVHSGDDITGTGDAFDEELLIKLPAVSDMIHSIYFVTASNHHGFNKIEGGSWSIISTNGERELLSMPLFSPGTENLHVMAKLTRGDESWSLDEIGAYHQLDPDENVSSSDKIHRLLRDKYLTPAGA